ncbi:cupin domain-containing protein [Leucobacter coleopterorum]|uniref:cupin domain-containing protein n=1 Tax=Leucobacter coleopterorum TaxID=2714933 RepID=UPI003CC7441B
MLRGTLEPGAWSSEEPWGHEAIECAYVDAGQLAVEVGNQSITVQAGESITFASQQPHRYGNPGETPTTFILTVSPPPLAARPTVWQFSEAEHLTSQQVQLCRRE